MANRAFKSGVGASAATSSRFDQDPNAAITLAHSEILSPLVMVVSNMLMSMTRGVVGLFSRA
ncbi:MAG: hypothetical protein NXI19_10405 [Alphaproteobacteria bacterium]|nr:hypothetical protein [Alphaproteobacteria bacterium]